MSELRIVAGEWRGQRIAVPPGPVRPTADKTRESWMNIVRAEIDGADVLDLCAGSGALGLEALSRGAAHCDFVERDPVVLRTLRANIAKLGAAERATVHAADARQFVAKATRIWDLAFADPPYAEPIASELSDMWIRRPFARVFGVEHEGFSLMSGPAEGATVDRRRYGRAGLTIYRTSA